MRMYFCSLHLRHEVADVDGWSLLSHCASCAFRRGNAHPKPGFHSLLATHPDSSSLADQILSDLSMTDFLHTIKQASKYMFLENVLIGE